MRLLMLIFCTIQVNYVFSQSETVIVDLAEFNGKSGTIEKPLDIKKIRTVLLENKFVAFPYNAVIEVEAMMLPPIVINRFEPANTSACQDLLISYQNAYILATTTDEDNADEHELKKALQRLIDVKQNSPCVDASLNKKIEELFAQTKKTIAVNIDLQPRENLVITVTHGDKVFKMVFSGKQNSRWVINYGFAFTSRALEPKKYFLEDLGADSFKINKKKKYDILDLRFTPAIFFSYFLNKNLNKNFNHSLTGGLGFNTQTPVVFLGYNAMYNQNVGISFGLGFYEQQKLLGKYKENQILKEPLDEEQLYETLIFRPNLFLSFNFRFADNPFKATNPTPPTE